MPERDEREWKEQTCPKEAGQHIGGRTMEYEPRGFKTDVMLHGGDYNPEQWLEHPEILEADLRILKASGCNVVSMGIFSWSMLEPQEGVFQLDWMEKIIDQLYAQGIRVILATPSGARPKWLADKYPEVLRVDERRVKQLFGARHNHCLTSPVYREKVARIDEELSRRFGHHPGVILWHISNEFGGDCHCPLCQAAFREWVKERYGSIEEVNRRWYTTFWSHTYSGFDQIESPSSIGENALHGLNLDWKRFVTEQTASFIAGEREALRKHSDLPVTTNFMYYFSSLNYFRLAKELDVTSWDTYPAWHKYPMWETATDNGFWHDMIRSLLDRPFIQMESSPSSTNWQGVSKLRRPGVLMAQGLQAIAHGADAALYFQIRQSRGSSEKFHGAVIDHYGGEDTRIIREVTETGEALRKLSEVTGSRVESPVAIIYDWESLWAMNDAQGPRNEGLYEKELMLKLYHGCRRLGCNVDLKDESADLSRYKVVIVPMTYQFREGFADKLRAFAGQGGQLLVTMHSGVADDTDLCYLGGAPHGLMDVLGLRSTEIDGLFDWEENHLAPTQEAGEAFQGVYACKVLCDLPRLDTAKALLTYQEDFYQGLAAVTVHPYGKGQAWYLATNADERLCNDLMMAVFRAADHPVLGPFPDGVEVTERVGEKGRYLFVQNFSDRPYEMAPPAGRYEALLGDAKAPVPVTQTLVLKVWA